METLNLQRQEAPLRRLMGPGPLDVHQVFRQLKGFVGHLPGTLQPRSIVMEQLRIVVPDHRHARPRGADNRFGCFENFDEPSGGHPCLPAIAGIESRLPAAGLPGRAVQVKSKAAKNFNHGFTHFRVNAIDQALDEQGYGFRLAHK